MCKILLDELLDNLPLVIVESVFLDVLTEESELSLLVTKALFLYEIGIERDRASLLLTVNLPSDLRSMLLVLQEVSKLLELLLK